MQKQSLHAFLTLVLGLHLFLAVFLTFSANAADPSKATTSAIATQHGRSSQNERLIEIAKREIATNPETFDLTLNDINSLEVTDIYSSSHTGVTHIYFRQTFQGLPVLNGTININLDRNGNPLISYNRQAGNLSQWNEQAAQRLIRSAGVIDPGRAAIEAAKALNIPVLNYPTVIQTTRNLRNETLLASGGISTEPIPAALGYIVANENGPLLPVWELTINEESRPNLWQAFVHAESGQFIEAHNLVLEDRWPLMSSQPANLDQLSIESNQTQPDKRRTTPNNSYRVLPLPLGNPSEGSFALVTDPAHPLASPYGWHDTDGVTGAEFTDTRGNNVYVQEDEDANDSGGERVSGGDALIFDYSFDPTQGPDEDSNGQAAAVNLFYINNLTHDLFYLYGFDEASGNFQQNNYGKGGIEGDPLIADLHDGRAVNNAYFTIGAEGKSPRMEMFIWNFADPHRDSALENSVIIHEYTHGLTTRLTGGPTNIQCLFNNEQMGEGWSDFFGLVMTMEPNDQASDPRGYGTYLNNQPSSSKGIRLAPYSTDKNINSYTYADIASFPNSPSRPHQIGFVFGSMLWDLTWRLVETHGFSSDLTAGWESGGNTLALQLVMDSLKLQPCQPGFVDSRDAILAADQALTGGENRCLIWEAFAGRGLGYSADQGSPSISTDGTEAFDLPTVCQQFLKIETQASSAIVGVNRTISYTLVITNDTPGMLNNLRVTDQLPGNVTYVDGSASNSGFLDGDQIRFPPFNLSPGQSAKRTLSVEADRWEENHSLSFADNFEGGLNAWTASGLWRLAQEDESCGEGTKPFPSSDSVAYFGNSGCTYEDSQTGFLSLKEPIKLVGEQPILRFESLEAVEPPGTYDRMYVELSRDEGETWSQLKEIRRDFSEARQWRTESIDLSPYRDETVSIRFKFVSDNFISNYLGWMIDNVYIGPLELVQNQACVQALQGDRACDTAETQIIGGPNIRFDLTIGDSPIGCSQTDTLYVPTLDRSAYLCYTMTNFGTVALGTHTLEDTVLGSLLTNEKFIVKPGETYRFTRGISISSDQSFHSTWTAVQGHMVTSDGDQAHVYLAAAPSSCTGFEEASLPPYISIYQSDPQARGSITTQAARTGSQALTLDTVCQFCNQKTTQAAVLRLDLRDPNSAELDFHINPHNDQVEPEDGLFLSDHKGETYVKIYAFDDLLPNQFNRVRVDLSSLAASAGIDTRNGNLLKIQGAGQHPAFESSQNNPTERDGYTIDDLCLNRLTDRVSFNVHIAEEGETCDDPARGSSRPVYIRAGDDAHYCFSVENDTLITFDSIVIEASSSDTPLLTAQQLQPGQRVNHTESLPVSGPSVVSATLALTHEAQQIAHSMLRSVELRPLQPLNETACHQFEGDNLPEFIKPLEGGESSVRLDTGPSQSGSRHITLDAVCETCATNAQIELLTALEGVKNAELYWWINNSNPSNSQSLIELSIDNGKTFIKIGQLASETNGFIKQSLNLGEILSDLELSYTDDMRFRLTHHLEGDHRASVLIDDLCIDISQAVNLDISAVAPAIGEPGREIAYPILIKNSGLTTLTYLLDVEAATNWGASLSTSSVTLAPAETEEVTVRLQVPLDAARGTQLAATVTAKASNNGTIFDDIQLYPTIQRRVDLMFEGETERIGKPGDWVTHSIDIINHGYLTDTVDLSLVQNDGWETELLTNVLLLSPGEKQTVPIRVKIPTGTTDSNNNSIDLIARSQSDPNTQARITLLTSSAIDFTLMLPVNRLDVSGGQWSTLPLTLQNTGLLSETFLFSLSGLDETLTQLGFKIELDKDEIILGPGQSGTVEIKLFTPTGLLTTQTVEATVAGRPASNQGGISNLNFVAVYEPYRQALPFVFKP